MAKADREAAGVTLAAAGGRPGGGRCACRKHYARAGHPAPAHAGSGGATLARNRSPMPRARLCGRTDV
eukprot:12035282-Alexandrium_andersonii.AAC.1